MRQYKKILSLILVSDDPYLSGGNFHSPMGPGPNSFVDSAAGGVTSPPNRCDALSPVLSPTSPTSDTEQTTGILLTKTNKSFLFPSRNFPQRIEKLLPLRAFSQRMLAFNFFLVFHLF